MDFAIVYCVALTSYGKALYLHFYYLTIWTYVYMYVLLSGVKLLLLLYYYYYHIYIDVILLNKVDQSINMLTGESHQPRLRDEDDELLQFAIRQSVMEAGAEKDQV